MEIQTKKLRKSTQMKRNPEKCAVGLAKKMCVSRRGKVLNSSLLFSLVTILMLYQKKIINF